MCCVWVRPMNGCAPSMNSRCACDMGSLEKARDSPHYGIVAENRLTELEKRQQALDVKDTHAGLALMMTC